METSQDSEQLSVYQTRESLLLRLKKGQDECAWHEFHSIYGRLIFGYSLHFNISYAEAEDIVQEVCIKVFRQIVRFDYSPAKGRFRGWLKTITRNTVIDYLRRKQSRRNTSDKYREHLESELDAEAKVDDELWQMEWERSLYENALERVRERIGEDSFRAFKLYVLENVKMQEVVDATGLKANAVYAVKHRVLKYLREEIDIILRDGEIEEN